MAGKTAKRPCEADLEALRQRIREAFPPTAYKGEVTACRCAECNQIKRDFRRKSWDQVSAEAIDLTESPVLFHEVEAVHAFLPAFLLRALDDLDEKTTVLEMTIYSISPCTEDVERRSDSPEFEQMRVTRLRRLHQMLSPSQLRVLRDFLVFAGDYSASADWYRPYISRALNEIYLEAEPDEPS
ncbi:MAG: hypothetical protein IH602_07600 [Bryobacteraceae bacterium]|nr:hypothetical protein [Bryobacteraceae bacterium]